MKARSIGKLCSAILFGFLISLLMEHELVSRRQMTRAAFLTQQGERYDKQVARPMPFSFLLLASVLTTGVFLGAYELVGNGISRVAEKVGG